MNICEKEKCTGCGCCVQSCSKGAIELVLDEYGYQKYRINEDKCIKCGLCIRICPSNHLMECKPPRSVYAAYSLNDLIYKKAASGGVASNFYLYALEQGFSIFGAKFNKEFSLEIVEGDSISDIRSFAGSKYIKSDMLKSFSVIKKRIKEGKKVLFIGLPCQVVAIKQFIGKEEKKLLTVDLVCHGAPPQLYLQDYIKKFKKKYGDFDDIQFREEGRFVFRILKGDKAVYNKPSYKDFYMFSFLKAITYTDACYQCPYARKERVSDITISDFWGIEETSFSKEKEKVSAVLINTKLGEEFWEECKELFYVEEFELSDVVRTNAQLQHPSIEHPYRKKFLQKYKKGHDFRESLHRTNVTKEIIKYYVKDWLQKGGGE